MKYRTPYLLLSLIVLAACNKENNPTLFSLSISVVPENSGFVENFSDTLLEKNSTVELRAVSKEGYVFAGWEGKISSNENPLELTMTQDTDLVANFEKKTYPLNVSIVGDGEVMESIIKTKTDYEYGTVVQLEAIPDSSWAFERWEGSTNQESNTIELTVTSEMNITAFFKKATIDYCLPIKLNGYAHTTSSDSVHFLDYNFRYEKQFLTSYIRYYNNTKGSTDDVSTFFEAKYAYDNGLIHKIVEENHLVSGDLWASYDYTLDWESEKLSSLNYSFVVGSQTGDVESTSIVYEEPCGLRFFEAEGIEVGIQIGYSREFLYSNDCLSYRIKGGGKQRGFETQNSIFKDLQGLNGFIGSSYIFMFSETGPTPFYNKENLRLSRVTSQYINPDQPYIGTSVNFETITENYFYKSFIQDQDYPRYFSRIITDTKDDSETKDTFTVNYVCQYK